MHTCLDIQHNNQELSYNKVTTSTKAKLWNQTVIQENNNSYRVSKFDYRDAALKIFDLVVLGIHKNKT